MRINKRYRKVNFFLIIWYLGFSLDVFLNHSLMAASAREPLIVVSEARTETILKQVPLTGTITSAKIARLSPEVSGQVENITVDVGDQVKTGDVLIRLDSEIEQLTLQSAKAGTAQAQAELADARRRYKDAERLKKQNSISDNAIRLLQAEVEIDTAAVKRQQAEQLRQQALVDRHILQAPFNGVISQKLTEIGEWIVPGNAVLTLVSVDDLRIDFRVPQEFYPRIDKQSRISVWLDSQPGHVYEGMIDAVVPVTDPNARTFLLQVRLDSAEINMTPGMSAQGQLSLNTTNTGVVISRDALLRYPDGRITVWVVNTNDAKPTVKEQTVKIGHSFNGLISIAEGIQAGDTVVIEGNEALQNGQQVRIQGNQ